MIEKLLLILLIVIATNTYAKSQTDRMFVADYSTSEFPIFFEGNVKAIHLSKDNDTLKIVNYKHNILIEKDIDTIVVSVYFKGEAENARESINRYKFYIEDNLIFPQEKDYLNFPEIAKLLFMKEAPQSGILHLPIREYIGEKEILYFGAVDSLFKFSIRPQATKTDKNFIERYFKKFQVPKVNTEFYCFGISWYIEDERFPPFHDGMQIPERLIGKPGYTEIYSHAYKYIFVKNFSSKTFNTIIREEKTESSSPIREYRKMNKKGVYLKTEASHNMLKK